MPWIWGVIWLSLPWVGALFTILGNPNQLYSRRVLIWSMGCFMILSLGLGCAHVYRVMPLPPFLTLQTMILAMILSDLIFIASWPRGKAALGLTVLGCCLLLFIGFFEQKWITWIESFWP
jgi:hypothetical protein